MNIGKNIAILGVELTIKQPLVSTATAGNKIETLGAEIKQLVAQINLASPSGSLSSTNFNLAWSCPLTFDVVFATPIRKSSVTIPTDISVKDQNGKITTTVTQVDPNGSMYVSVVGQVFRAEYLKRLYNLIESSTQKTILLNELDAKLASLYETALILAPVADDLFAAFDGGLYLYRDTITTNSEFFVSLPFNSLPAQIQADFQFMRSSAVNGLYSLSGYTPGMNAGIEDALMNRGALSKLNDSSKWLHVAETLDAHVIVPNSISNLVAYEAPRVLAFVTLGRKVSVKNSEISLSELDSNTMKFVKALRKIANKTDLVVVSTNELVHDVIELAPLLSSNVAIQTQFVKLYCKLVGVTSQSIVYEPGATEAQKRLIRIAISQWRYDLSGITGLTVSAVNSTILFKAGTALVGTLTYSGPFAADIAQIEVARAADLQTVINTLAAVSALIDTAVLSKAFGIVPATGELQFTYTIDQLKEAVAEIIVDTSRAMYKRS